MRYINTISARFEGDVNVMVTLLLNDGGTLEYTAIEGGFTDEQTDGDPDTITYCLLEIIRSTGLKLFDEQGLDTCKDVLECTWNAEMSLTSYRANDLVP